MDNLEKLFQQFEEKKEKPQPATLQEKADRKEAAPAAKKPARKKVEIEYLSVGGSRNESWSSWLSRHNSEDPKIARALRIVTTTGIALILVALFWFTIAAMQNKSHIRSLSTGTSQPAAPVQAEVPAAALPAVASPAPRKTGPAECNGVPSFVYSPGPPVEKTTAPPEDSGNPEIPAAVPTLEDDWSSPYPVATSVSSQKKDDTPVSPEPTPPEEERLKPGARIH